MNASQNETFFVLFFLRLTIGEGAFRHADIVADVRQLDRGPAILPVDRGPPVELQTARRRSAAQENKRQRSVLARVARTDRYDVRIAARDDLRAALEVGRTRQEDSK